MDDIHDFDDDNNNNDHTNNNKQQCLKDNRQALLQREELLKLREWKEHIGILAVNKNASLELLIEELRMRNEEYKLNIDNLIDQQQTTQLELRTFREEVTKLQHEKEELLTEINVFRNNVTNDKILQLQLREKNELIDNLREKMIELNCELSSIKQEFNAIITENNHLKLENQQYDIILDKLQKSDVQLKKKIKNESKELNDLKTKYDELHITVQDHQNKLNITAQENIKLKQDAADMRDHINISVIGPDTNHQIDNFTDASNKNLGGGHHSAKTIRIEQPNTIRLENVGLLLNAHSFTSVTPATSMHGRHSSSKYIFSPHIVSNSSMYTPISHFDDNDDHPDNDDDDFKVIADNDFDGFDEMKEKLLIEFDNKLAIEKGILYEKHKKVLNTLNNQLDNMRDQKNDLQKQLTDTHFKLKQMQSRRHRHNAFNNNNNNNNNNGNDKSVCKLFGWTAF